MIGRLLCLFGRHRLHALKTLGVSQHLACERCFRQFAINHDMRAFLPWDASFADMYQRHCGYNDITNFRDWKQWIMRGKPLDSEGNPA